jgi:hypothetical protein
VVEVAELSEVANADALCHTDKGIHVGYVVSLGGFGSRVCFLDCILEVVPSC